MTLIESKSASCRHNLPDIGLSSSVCVMIEEWIKIFNLLDIESWILCDDGFAEYGSPLVFNDRLAIDFAHGYISSNII